jgi:hypothetical protein
LVEITAERAERAHQLLVPVVGDCDDVKRRADIDAGGMEVDRG